MSDIKQIHIKLDSSLHQALKLEAVYCKKTIQDLVVELIIERVKSSNSLNLPDDSSWNIENDQ